jgi:hypothetical protein
MTHVTRWIAHRRASTMRLAGRMSRIRTAIMSEPAPSRLSLAMMWAVVTIATVALVLGIAWYGVSWEVHERFWSDVFGRMHGPMTLRFYSQPTLAFVAALKDGVKDARLGHKAFFWTALWDPTQPRGRLRQGLMSTSQMALIGFAMDVVYQFKVFDRFYPVEAVMMVLLLAVIPYFVLRWIVEQVARWSVLRSGVAS